MHTPDPPESDPTPQNNPYTHPSQQNLSPYGVNPQPGMQPVPPKKNTWLIITVVALACAVPMLCVCAGLLLPAVQAAREAARRMSCSNNIKQIGMAMHNYHDTYKSLPPAYTVDASGRPLHSWRTLLLPFVEQQALYNKIDLSKPWDDPVNIAISEVVVPIYACPSSQPGPATTYFVVVDPSSCFPGSTPVKFRQFLDGTSNTLMVVECETSSVIPWMMPQDIDLNEYMSLSGDAHARSHQGGENSLMADGMVVFYTSGLSASERQDLVSINGPVDSARGNLNPNGMPRGATSGRLPSIPGYAHPESKAVLETPAGWNLLTGAEAKQINAAANAVLMHDGNAQHGERIGILIIEQPSDLDLANLDYEEFAKVLVDGMGIENKKLESVKVENLYSTEIGRYIVSGDVEGAPRLRYDGSIFSKNGYLIQVIVFGAAEDLRQGDQAAKEVYDALTFSP